jgi:hypothetical protein
MSRTPVAPSPSSVVVSRPVSFGMLRFVMNLRCEDVNGTECLSYVAIVEFLRPPFWGNVRGQWVGRWQASQQGPDWNQEILWHCQEEPSNGFDRGTRISYLYLSFFQFVTLPSISYHNFGWWSWRLKSMSVLDRTWVLRYCATDFNVAPTFLRGSLKVPYIL